MSNIFTYFEEESEKNLNFKKECDIEKINLNCSIALKELRKSKGLSQKELSKKTGLSQQSISRIEKYNHSCNLTTIIKYLYGCDVDLSKILKGIK